jgi:hypothetical protein
MVEKTKIKRRYGHCLSKKVEYLKSRLIAGSNDLPAIKQSKT